MQVGFSFIVVLLQSNLGHLILEFWTTEPMPKWSRYHKLSFTVLSLYVHFVWSLPSIILNTQEWLSRKNNQILLSSDQKLFSDQDWHHTLHHKSVDAFSTHLKDIASLSLHPFSFLSICLGERPKESTKACRLALLDFHCHPAFHYLTHLNKSSHHLES